MSQLYTGRENDGTGLMYYRARYYHAGCARFISEDPIGWASGQTNNYAYVGGDPVSNIDPSGLKPIGRCAIEHYGLEDFFGDGNGDAEVPAGALHVEWSLRGRFLFLKLCRRAGAPGNKLLHKRMEQGRFACPYPCFPKPVDKVG